MEIFEGQMEPRGVDKATKGTNNKLMYLPVGGKNHIYMHLTLSEAQTEAKSYISQIHY